MKKTLTPRNPFVVHAKSRKAGSHTKSIQRLRRQTKQALAKMIKQQLPDSWQKGILVKCVFAMNPMSTKVRWPLNGPFTLLVNEWVHRPFARSG